MNINIGELIKEEMDRQGITATQLAKKIYCERTNVINITHRNSINTELLMRICRALKVNYFSILADEMWKEGLPKPDDSNNNGQLAMVIDKNDIPYFNDKDISEGFKEIKVLDISLIINGVNFDESLELPQEVFPLLIYAYSCALDGPLKNMDDEQLDENFFPWLIDNHPRLACFIMNAVEDLLTERIADDVEGTYRDVINYEEPADINDWYALSDNKIKYMLGGLTERIRYAKRPLQWLLPPFDLYSEPIKSEYSQIFAGDKTAEE